MTQRSLHLPLIHNLNTLTPAETAQTLRDKGTQVEINCLNWAKDFPKSPESRVMLAHDGNAIYALFTLHTDELRAAATADLQPVASDNCFEIFLKKAGDTHYCNFEFNYRGFANVSRRPGRMGAVKFTPDKLAQIGRYPLTDAPLPHESRKADPAEEVALLAVIPLSLIEVEPDAKTPIALEGNIYSCSDGCKEPYFLTWAPVPTPTPDFHRPDYFAPIILGNNE